MKVVTWNVNSVKVRKERLLAWLDKHKPDVLCLQELKGTRESFPELEVAAAGYRAALYGQKTYNGVAILARNELPLSAVREGLDDGVDDPQARLLSAQVGPLRVVSAYVPNGGELGSDKWTYKLAWLERLRAYLERTAKPDDKLVVCGDYNVAPRDVDVHDPDEWRDTVLCHPEARARFEALCAWGLTDVFQKHHPEGKVFSWWDYRQLGFPKNRGLRIDHVLATAPVAAKSVGARVDRDERKGQGASDHAPVECEFEAL